MEKENKLLVAYEHIESILKVNDINVSGYGSQQYNSAVILHSVGMVGGTIAAKV